MTPKTIESRVAQRQRNDAFKERLHEVISSMPEWPDMESGTKNRMRCYDINTKIQTALVDKGIEAVLVGAHMAGSSGAANYYVLARNPEDGGVMLIDGVISSVPAVMRGGVYIGTYKEVTDLIRRQITIPWREVWDLRKNEGIVIHRPEVPREEQVAFREKWGEFSKSMTFEIPGREEKQEPHAATRGAHRPVEHERIAARHRPRLPWQRNSPKDNTPHWEK